MQALPELYFTLLRFWEQSGFFSEYCRSAHMRSICREQLQRLQYPKCIFLGHFRGISGALPSGSGHSFPWPWIQVSMGLECPFSWDEGELGRQSLPGPLVLPAFPIPAAPAPPSAGGEQGICHPWAAADASPEPVNPAGPGGDSLHDLRQKSLALPSPRTRQEPSAAAPISQSIPRAPSPVQIPGKIPGTHHFPYPKTQPMFALGNGC